MLKKFSADCIAATLKIYEESIGDVIGTKIRRRLFSAGTNGSCNLFLRCGDSISVNPQINGIHEPALVGIFEEYAKKGYADFLIDIGANIGLSSCQSGNLFQQVHMFEPNPLCVKILEVNTKIALTTEFKIHPYGLGDENKICTLTVPRFNWGGAFVNDKSNAYDQGTLTSKDGLASFDAKNYFNVDIEILKTSEALKPVFDALRQRNLKRGIIKIDVEGYESVVIKGIADSIPSDVQAIIVFENWSAKLNISDVIAPFSRETRLYRLVRKTPWDETDSQIVKLLKLALNRKVVSELVPGLGENPVGELVLELN